MVPRPTAHDLASSARRHRRTGTLASLFSVAAHLGGTGGQCALPGDACASRVPCASPRRQVHPAGIGRICRRSCPSAAAVARSCFNRNVNMLLLVFSLVSSHFFTSFMRRPSAVPSSATGWSSTLPSSNPSTRPFPESRSSTNLPVGGLPADLVAPVGAYPLGLAASALSCDSIASNRSRPARNLFEPKRVFFWWTNPRCRARSFF
ncbi:hypothetical protein PF010_g29716, partial [Phytophthora fragariae]